MKEADEVRIVLVEPSHPGNIGAAARAMKTMGLSRLYVVNPKRYPDPQAQWRAAGGEDVLDEAVVCGTLEEAIDDCHWVVGTSARQRRIPWPILTPEAMAEEVNARPGQRIGVLFGREDSGLTNEELQRCNAHIEIPANPVYPVLNVAMAVQVICYALHRHMGAPVQPLVWDRPPAPLASVEALLARFDAVLTATGFINAEQPGQTMTRIRRLLARTQLDETELGVLHGLLTHIERPPGD